MRIVHTKSEIIKFLRQEVKWLRDENKTLKAVIRKICRDNTCTCHIDKKQCVLGEDLMKCPVHGRSFKKGELKHVSVS